MIINIITHFYKYFFFAFNAYLMFFSPALSVNEKKKKITKLTWWNEIEEKLSKKEMNEIRTSLVLIY